MLGAPEVATSGVFERPRGELCVRAIKIGLGLGQNRQLHEVDAKCRVLLTQTQATGSTTRSHPTARGRATVRLRALASAARRPALG